MTRPIMKNLPAQALHRCKGNLVMLVESVDRAKKSYIRNSLDCHQAK